MGLKKKIASISFALIMTGTSAQVTAPNAEIEELFRDLAGMAAGTPETSERAQPVLKHFVQGSRESVAGALPIIVRAASDPHLSVRREAAVCLFEIMMRPDGRILLSAQTEIFSSLLVDPDTPIRRITGITIQGLLLNASSPLLPALEAFLVREDAVSTIGPGVVGLLIQAAPSREDSTRAVVKFMRRQDHTLRSRADVLQSIRVTRSNNREIGKEVAAYADDPDLQLSVDAIETLQCMGKTVVLDNQQSLTRIAADRNRTPEMRAAATKALSMAQ